MDHISATYHSVTLGVHSLCSGYCKSFQDHGLQRAPSDSFGRPLTSRTVSTGTQFHMLFFQLWTIPVEECSQKILCHDANLYGNFAGNIQEQAWERRQYLAGVPFLKKLDRFCILHRYTCHEVGINLGLLRVQS